MALPNQLKAARMTNATAASAVPANTVAAEQAVADILGVTVDVNVLAPAFFLHAANLMTVPMVKAARVAALDTVIDTPIIIEFDAEEYDRGSMYTLTVPSRITCNTAGKYLVTGSVNYTTFATGFRRIEILKNGTSVSRVGTEGVGAFSSVDNLNLTIQLSLAVADYLQLEFTQSGSSTIDVVNPTFLAAYRLGG